MATNIRAAAVAGRFYPLDSETLAQEVGSYLSQTPVGRPVPSLGCVVPHAGYMYSGHVAGAVFARLEVPARCILLCPNHTGAGKPLAIMSTGAWETPLGNLEIDAALASALKGRCPLLQEDSLAHRAEHSAEVELPFLQVRQPHAKFVPIALGTRRFEILEQLGDAIADVVKASGEPILIVASSDMNHYESDPATRVKDHNAIERILALDTTGLNDVVIEQNISMCGFGPTIAMLTAVKRLGATTAELVKYATSGDVSGDRDMVVGYAGMIIR